MPYRPGEKRERVGASLFPRPVFYFLKSLDREGDWAYIVIMQAGHVQET